MAAVTADQVTPRAVLASYKTKKASRDAGGLFIAEVIRIEIRGAEGRLSKQMFTFLLLFFMKRCTVALRGVLPF